ncbi:MAG TPA: hypothetical protein EYM98_10665 [Dehalococcoidia bacterium]|nr:hypothetical protein [Dehalococcoidia bacterium]
MMFVRNSGERLPRRAGRHSRGSAGSSAAIRSRKNTETLKALEKSNRRIYRAWRLKDEFEQFWDYRAPWGRKKVYRGLDGDAMRSRLEPIKKFVRMLRTHAEDILAFIRTRLTNAISEGLNRIIKIIKNRASGFRSLDPFKDLIFLTVGDVDIPAQIPARFHTL